MHNGNAAGAGGGEGVSLSVSCRGRHLAKHFKNWSLGKCRLRMTAGQIQRTAGFIPSLLLLKEKNNVQGKYHQDEFYAIFVFTNRGQSCTIETSPVRHRKNTHEKECQPDVLICVCSGRNLVSIHTAEKKNVNTQQRKAQISLTCNLHPHTN